MKIICWFILLFLIVHVVIAQSPQNTPTGKEKWKREWAPRTASAAIAGDEAALAVFSKMPEKERLVYLQSIAINKRMDKLTANKALEVIKKIDGYCEFYRGQIVSDKTGENQMDRYRALKVLLLLNTDESVRIVAEFLFDTSKPTIKAEGDQPAPGSNSELALQVLSEAKIEGAPTRPVTSDNAEVNLKEWQQWWLKTHPSK